MKTIALINAQTTVKGVSALNATILKTYKASQKTMARISQAIENKLSELRSKRAPRLAKTATAKKTRTAKTPELVTA